MAQTPRARVRRHTSDFAHHHFVERLEQRTLLATVPAGFTDAQVAAGLNSPTAMALAPDGRVFVAEKNGAVRIIKNNQLLSQPFATVTVNTQAQRGLGGIVLDPDFPNNGYVYVYYTATQPNVHNRIARFTASGDVAVSGSHTVLFDLPEIGGAINHLGGALHFGADGKLYAAIGDHDRGNDTATLQSIHNVWGKMLRLNSDGSIPSDNPFYTQTTGINRAVWAYGLRNPFTAAVQPGTGRIFINDVGELSWEEINEGIAGANYGWPVSEGPTSNPSFVAPFYAYPTSEGCAITGGDFYNPAVNQFPAEYRGKYFFADNCGGWIRSLDLVTRQATTFATGASQPVDIDVAPDGTLYYLQRGNNSVRRITYAATPEPNVSTSTFIYNFAPQRLVFRFTTNVSASLGVNDLVLFNQTTGTTIPSANIALTYDATNQSGTFTFPGYASGALPDGRYRATLLASGITAPGGQPMPANHTFDFFFLRGDANRDGRVNLADFNILAANFGQSNRTFAQADFNYDGTVNLSDFNLLASRFGSSLFGPETDAEEDILPPRSRDTIPTPRR